MLFIFGVVNFSGGERVHIYSKRRGYPQNKVSIEDDVVVDDSSDTEEDTPIDLEATNKMVLIEEIQDIKESQQLIQKQKRRRELDKSLLDKGITRFIEFFENIFSWKVIDV